MTKFNPENKEDLTYGECLDPIATITEQEDADQYFAAYVEYVKTFLSDSEISRAEEIARHNIGYFAGYYSQEVRDRVNKLFKTKHPILDLF